MEQMIYSDPIEQFLRGVTTNPRVTREKAVEKLHLNCPGVEEHITFILLAEAQKYIVEPLPDDGPSVALLLAIDSIVRKHAGCLRA